MEITANTLLTFTEIKRGQTTGKTYDLTAEAFISIVKNKDSDGDLAVNPREDADGEFHDDFYKLPVSEQLDMCCVAEGDRYAANVTCKPKSSPPIILSSNGPCSARRQEDANATNERLGRRE